MNIYYQLTGTLMVGMFTERLLDVYCPTNDEKNLKFEVQGVV